MTAVSFDTLKFVETLEASGVSHGQAKATAQAFSEATSQELATKSDLAVQNSEIKAEFALVRAEVKDMIATAKIDLIKWMVGLFLAQTAVVLAVLRAATH